MKITVDLLKKAALLLKLFGDTYDTDIIEFDTDEEKIRLFTEEGLLLKEEDF